MNRTTCTIIGYVSVLYDTLDVSQKVYVALKVGCYHKCAIQFIQSFPKETCILA